MRRAGLVLAALVLVACAREETPQPEPVRAAEAEAVVSALLTADGAALAPWWREGRALTVHERCPSCPKERRETAREVPSGEAQRAFVGGLVRAAAAPADRPEPAPLKVGEMTCGRRCCRFAVGMLDHASYHLERLCFDRDARGLVLTEVAIVDGG